MGNVSAVNATVHPAGLVKGAANQTAPMHVTLEESACQEAASANLVGEEKLAKSKNAQISALARHKVHAIPKHLNARAKKDGLGTIAARRLAQKTVTDTANAKAMVFVCARICGPAKAASSQLAQIHAVVMVCALVINVNAILNSKEMTAQYGSAQMHALVMENAWIKRTTNVNAQMVSPVKTAAGRNASTSATRLTEVASLRNRKKVKKSRNVFAAKDGPVPIACRKHAKDVSTENAWRASVCAIKDLLERNATKPAVLTTATTMEPATLTTKVMVSANVPWDTMVKHAKRKIVQMDALGMVFAKQLNVLARKVTLAKIVVNVAAQPTI